MDLILRLINFFLESKFFTPLIFQANCNSNFFSQFNW